MDRSLTSLTEPPMHLCICITSGEFLHQDPSDGDSLGLWGAQKSASLDEVQEILMNADTESSSTVHIQPLVPMDHPDLIAYTHPHIHHRCWLQRNSHQCPKAPSLPTSTCTCCPPCRGFPFPPPPSLLSPNGKVFLPIRAPSKYYHLHKAHPDSQRQTLSHCPLCTQSILYSSS